MKLILAALLLLYGGAVAADEMAILIIDPLQQGDNQDAILIIDPVSAEVLGMVAHATAAGMRG